MLLAGAPASVQSEPSYRNLIYKQDYTSTRTTADHGNNANSVVLEDDGTEGLQRLEVVAQDDRPSSASTRAPTPGTTDPVATVDQQQQQQQQQQQGGGASGDYGGAPAAADTAAVSALSAAVASGALAPAPENVVVVGNLVTRRAPTMPMPVTPTAQYTMAALGDRLVEVKLLLPNSRVGVVIGKGGAMINHVRETSKANLDISSETGTASAERIVTFSGEFGAVYSALSMVLQHLAISNQLGGLEASIIEATLLVPRNKTGGLIGRSGASINRLRQESGAIVKVGAPEDIVPTDPDVRKCIVSGTVDKVMQAVTLIIHKLEETPAGLTRTPPDPAAMGVYGAASIGAGPLAMGNPARQIQQAPPPQALPPGAIPVQFQVPNESMGAVIGRGGSTINQIRQMSGAKVDIAQSVPGMPMRLVTVTGLPDQIQMAQYLIQVKMGGGPLPPSSFSLVGMGASTAGSNDYALAAQQQQQQQQQVFQQQQQLENYGQYNQQEYQQQFQQMHQMQQQQGGYHGYGGF